MGVALPGQANMFTDHTPHLKFRQPAAQSSPSSRLVGAFSQIVQLAHDRSESVPARAHVSLGDLPAHFPVNVCKRAAQKTSCCAPYDT